MTIPRAAMPAGFFLEAADPIAGRWQTDALRPARLQRRHGGSNDPPYGVRAGSRATQSIAASSTGCAAAAFGSLTTATRM